MKWATFREPLSQQVRVGLVMGEQLHALAPRLPLLELLGDDGERLAKAAEHARRDPVGVFELADVELLAPIPSPPSMRDFMAFEAHVANTQQALGRSVPAQWYELPVFYFSNPAAIVGPHADIAIAPGSSAWDYELEVAAIIGRAGSNLTVEQAEEHIVGYSVLCDFSARDLQVREMQVGLGPAKAKDTATSLGPFLVTKDELEVHRSQRGFALAMTARVNGRSYSEGRLDTLGWSFAELLAYASRGTELRSGDVIGSGTVGRGCILELSLMHGAASYPWLVPGDRVELEVEGLGQLSHRIVAGATEHPLTPRARG